MKIFFLPNNIASMTAITVDAINKTGEHEARGLIFTNTTTIQTHLNLKVISFDKNSKLKYFLFLKWYWYFLKNLFWCDVIHWNGSFDILLLKLTMPAIRMMKKPALVEFVGGERNPEIEMLDNEYYREIYYSGYEYPYETVVNSEITQQLFSKGGFSGIALPGLSQHYSPQFFKRVYKCFQRIDISKFKPLYPNRNNDKLMIIHSPSAPIAKGTYQIVDVINELKKEFDFDFKLITNLPHKEALSLLLNADIFVDQIKLGHYGMASLEAMALGKPTLCYIKKYVLENNLPKEVPVINVTIKNLKQVLSELLSNPKKLDDIGIRSRAYVEKYHDIHNSIPMLIEIYEKEIKAKKELSN